MTKEERAQARRVRAEARDAVAFVMAMGLVTAINLIVIAVMYDAINTGSPEAAISENATQLLTMAIGGIVGVLGSYIGGKNATIGAEAATTAAEAVSPPMPDDYVVSIDDGPKNA